MVEVITQITCDKIMAERDRLTAAATNMLNLLATTGTAMLLKGAQDLTLQKIFASWHSQELQIPSSDPQDRPNELQVQI